MTVDKSAQELSVTVDGAPRYHWPVSTARMGYHTPNGTYKPQRLARKWFSRKYDWSPMPYSIFFDEGYAIHGSYEISHLGRPASHGCIRLHPDNAALLFALVQEHMDDTTIVVTGERPEKARAREVEADAPRVRRKHRREEAEARPQTQQTFGNQRIAGTTASSSSSSRPAARRPLKARLHVISPWWGAPRSGASRTMRPQRVAILRDAALRAAPQDEVRESRASSLLFFDARGAHVSRFPLPRVREWSAGRAPEGW